MASTNGFVLRCITTLPYGEFKRLENISSEPMMEIILDDIPLDINVEMKRYTAVETDTELPENQVVEYVSFKILYGDDVDENKIREDFDPELRRMAYEYGDELNEEFAYLDCDTDYTQMVE